MIKKGFVLSVLASALISGQALALDAGEYRFNGFGTLGVTKMFGDSKGYDYGVNGQINNRWRGDAVSRLGGQLSYGITDTISVTGQLLAHAEHDTWKVTPEWVYVAWNARPDLTVRAGRLRDPVYMYSESLDVGFSYPWLRLPDEVYSVIQTKRYDGVDATYTVPTPLGSLDLMVGAGETKHDFFVMGDMYDLKTDKLFAVNASLHTDHYGTFRVSYAEADISIRIDETVVHPLVPEYPFQIDIDKSKGKYTSIGHRYDNGSQLSAAEWTSLIIEGDDKDQETAYYIMGGQRFADKYLGHVTYARGNKTGGVHQSSWTVGLNYTLSPSSILKAEFKRVRTDDSEGVFVHSHQDVFDYRAGLAPYPNHKANIVSVGVDFIF